MHSSPLNLRVRALLLTALGFAAVGPLVSQAQDARPRQDVAQVQAEAAKEGRANDRQNNDPRLNDDQSPRRSDQRGGRDVGHGGDDRVADLHRTHPHAAARCHDGFFTTTRDHDRACTRHGGIDIWLGL